MSKIIWAIVKFDFAGLHKYPAASGEHSHLRNPHRHTFKCEVYVQQFHNDRDIEYLELQSYLKSKYHADALLEFGIKSCEDIADGIYNHVCTFVASKDIPGESLIRKIKVSVTEDGENGVLVEF